MYVHQVPRSLSQSFAFVTDIRLHPNTTSRSETDLVFTMVLHKRSISVGQVFGNRRLSFGHLRCILFTQIPIITTESPSRSNIP
jgi:hypothetical protein